MLVYLSCFNGLNKKDLEAAMGKSDSGAETPLAHFLQMPISLTCAFYQCLHP